jgi:hypothetical protein
VSDRERESERASRLRVWGTTAPFTFTFTTPAPATASSGRGPVRQRRAYRAGTPEPVGSAGYRRAGMAGHHILAPARCDRGRTIGRESSPSRQRAMAGSNSANGRSGRGHRCRFQDAIVPSRLSAGFRRSHPGLCTVDTRHCAEMPCDGIAGTRDTIGAGCADHNPHGPHRALPRSPIHPVLENNHAQTAEPPAPYSS